MSRSPRFREKALAWWASHGIRPGDTAHMTEHYMLLGYRDYRRHSRNHGKGLSICGGSWGCIHSDYRRKHKGVKR